MQPEDPLEPPFAALDVRFSGAGLAVSVPLDVIVVSNVRDCSLTLFRLSDPAFPVIAELGTRGAGPLEFDFSTGTRVSGLM